MIGFKINQAKGLFFDRPAVVNAISRDDQKRMSKFGAGVRKRSQKSIQIRSGASQPGDPPHGHKTATKSRKSKSTGKTRVQSVSLLREFIYFVFDRSSRSVVIGPAKLNGRIGNAPEALEHGGPSQIWRSGKSVSANIKPRPFMQPAFDAELPAAPSLWAA